MHSPGFFAGLTEFTVPFGCADQITANRDEQNFLKNQHPEIAVENMEGAAFAHVCQLFNKPATEIRAISNYTGQKSRDWNWPDSLKALTMIAETIHNYQQGERC
jgi:nucleoside phosphorylase